MQREGDEKNTTRHMQPPVAPEAKLLDTGPRPGHSFLWSQWAPHFISLDLMSSSGDEDCVCQHAVAKIPLWAHTQQCWVILSTVARAHHNDRGVLSYSQSLQCMHSHRPRIKGAFLTLQPVLLGLPWILCQQRSI